VTKLRKEETNLHIKSYEIHNTDNAILLQQLAAEYEIIPRVPTLFVGDRVFQQGDVHTFAEISAAIKSLTANPESPLRRLDTEEPRTEGQLQKRVTLPAVLGAAAVDAVNPCAFAVLSLLLGTILIGDKSRRKVVAAGLAFTLSTFISYMCIGFGLLVVIQISGFQYYLYITIGILATLAGLWNLKDFLWYGKWFLIEVPKTWQPKLKQVTKGVSSVPGAFAVGFVISLFLLPCTSGPYVAIIGMLSSTTDRTQGILLLLLYNLIFILPFVFITLLVGFGLTTTARVESWRRAKLSKLHLITGVVMFGLGLTMLVFALTGQL